MRTLRLLPLIAALLLSACAGERAFHKEVAKVGTPTAYVKSVLQRHNVAGQEIINLRADPTVSDASKALLLKGYRTTVCSSTEIAADAATKDCRKGAAFRATDAIDAYEKLHDAQTEAEMQAAADALTALVVDLVSLIGSIK